MKDYFSNISHPLNRGGLSQQDRQNKMLAPGSVALDGRQLKDILAFLYQYARQVNFYKKNDQIHESDWIVFFQRSVPFQYALIGAYDLSGLENRFFAINKVIRNNPTYENTFLLFDLLFDMAAQLEQWADNLQADKSGLKKSVQDLIETNLSQQLKELIGLSNAAGQWGYRRKKNAARLDRFWDIKMRDIYAVNPSILQFKGSLKDKALHIQRLLERYFRTFWKGMEAIVVQANEEEQIEKSLLSSDSHNQEPHLGLLFAFLLLFKKVQGSLNQLSEKHLNFFYRKVLQLKEQPFVPDKAHLTFELAKQVEADILLEKGTRLKGGKDNNGQDIFFALEEELVLTKAKVASLRTLFIDQDVDAVAQTKKVNGLYMAPEANSADGKGEAFNKEQEPTWETVGSRLSKWDNPDMPTATPAPHPFARLGFILASKVLFLREGNRAITITVSFTKELPQAFIGETDFFNVFFTTEEGWMQTQSAVHSFNIIKEAGQAPKLEIDLSLPSDFPPIVAAPVDTLETNYGYNLPMIRLEVNTSTTKVFDYYHLYGQIRDIVITEVNIQVKVCGVRNLVVQNDQSVLDVNKPFMPFGPWPKKNSSNFYIGSEEVFCKNWKQIDLCVAWKDKPNFSEHYAAYDNKPNDTSFTADLFVRSKRDWSESTDPSALNLFTPNHSSETSPLCNPEFHYRIKSSAFVKLENCNEVPVVANGVQTDTECGFLRLRLGPNDFLHDDFNQTLARQILALASAEGNSADTFLLADKAKYDEAKTAALKALDAAKTTKTDTQRTVNTYNNLNRANILAFLTRVNQVGINANTANNTANTSQGNAQTSFDKIGGLAEEFTEIVLPNPPYTPLIETLSIDYCAEASVTAGDTFFTHLHPFSGTYQQFSKEDIENKRTTTLLPCFTDEGTLFIGLTNYKPGSNLNLLFQMDPATADPQEDKALVCWEFLRHNEWLPLRKDIEVLSDETDGLIQSGIVKLAIPNSISKEKTTILPVDLHWIKARVPLSTNAISESLIVQTQAARVQFVSGAENDLSRLSAPLKEGEIAKFATPLAAVKGINQLAPSFGGRPKEAANHLYQRLSERLRHKGRAVSLYDYERLILAAFKEIFKVKCLTHTLGSRKNESDIELAPGFVTLVLIPDLTKVKAPNPLEPRVSANTLAKVKSFLRQRTSPFIRLEVLNPIYQTIEVSAKVKFRKGKSANFYQKTLEEEIKSFLAPWIKAEAAQDISFGGKVYYSTVLKFVEDRDYVDYVVDLQFVTTEEEESNSQEAIAKTARTVLTSNETHSIEILTEEMETLTALSTSTSLAIGQFQIKQ